MAYTLIKGTFHIHYPDTPRNGPEPDGDTLKFQPDHRDLVESLPKAGRPPRFTQTGITTIRFEGIDALETHFRVDETMYHQHKNLADAARDRLLELTGFGEVTYFDDLPFKVETVENHPIDGYLLSNGLDVYGRVIAFAFVGQPAHTDGTSVFVEPHMLNASLNALMLQDGMAYGAFYLSLPSALREHLKQIVVEARSASKGLYAEATATTTASATITDPDDLQQLVIWPKLFRRLAAFYEEGHSDLADLDAWLRADPVDRDDRLLLPNQELGNMHDLIQVNGNQIRLTHLPEEVVIVPDGFTLPDSPVIPIGSGSVRIVAALINPAQQPERGHETVTLINTTDSSVDLAGWKIADNNGQQDLSGNLAAGETFRVTLENQLQLSNNRDTITVLSPGNRIVDQVSYERRDLPGEGKTMVF
jgi:endonuclease YncB( thermonuclease family)